MTEFNPQWKTFEALVKEVLEYGFNDGPQVNRARIEGWLNEAQINIARKVDAPEFQKTHTIELVQGQYKYALPEDLLRVEDVYFPELVTRLTMLDLQQFDSMGHGELGSGLSVGTAAAVVMYAGLAMYRTSSTSVGPPLGGTGKTHISFPYTV